MVAQYEKADFAAFKTNLLGGKYKDLTSARKGIGRMSAWSVAEKDKARALAEKHFGVPSGEPSAGTVKRPKAVKEVTPKAPTKRGSEKTAKVRTKKVRTEQEEAVTVSGSVLERITETDRQIKTFGGALDEMNKAKALGAPAEQVREGAKRAQAGLIQAVNNLCRLTGASSSAQVDDGNGSGNDAWDQAVAATSLPFLGPQELQPTSTASDNDSAVKEVTPKAPTKRGSEKTAVEPWTVGRFP